MFPTRREFLQQSAASLALSLTPSFAMASVNAPSKNAARYLICGGPNRNVVIMNLDTGDQKTIATDMIKPHGFVQNPMHPERVWAIRIFWPVVPEKDPATNTGVFAVELDIQNGQILQKIILPRNEGLGGHGFYSPNGKIIFIPRLNVTTGLTYLTGYDAENCEKIIVDYPLSKGVPHDAQLLRNGNALIANPGINGESYTSRVKEDELVEINLATGLIVRRLNFQDEKQMVNHFALLRDGTLLATSDGTPSEQSGRAYYGSYAANNLREIAFNNEVRPKTTSEFLSLAVDEANHRAIVTDVPNSRALLIDTQRGTFIKEIPKDLVTMAFDKRSNFFIGSDAELCLIDHDGNDIQIEEARRLSKGWTAGGPHSIILNTV